MDIIVIGAGIVGIASAYILAQAGHAVTLIEQSGAACTGQSHANGGQLAFSYSEPFASPGARQHLPRYLSGRDPGISIRLSTDPGFWRWGFEFLQNCTAARERANMEELFELAAQSQAAIGALRAPLPGGLLGGVPSGKLILTRNAQERRAFAASFTLKRRYGLMCEWLPKSEVLAREPALKGFKAEFNGAVYAPDDDKVNAAALGRALLARAQQSYGLNFQTHCTALRFVVQGTKVNAVETSLGLMSSDRIILCTGTAHKSLLRPLGESLPIYPLRGYSLTVPLGPCPPHASLTDPQHKIVFSKLGDQLRVAGFLDINIAPGKIRARQQALASLAQRLFPSAGRFDGDLQLWTGLRPATPSSRPVIGPSKYEGLIYNMGHGSMGLTFALGAANKILQQLGAPA